MGGIFRSILGGKFDNTARDTFRLTRLDIEYFAPSTFNTVVSINRVDGRVHKNSRKRVETVVKND